MTDRELTDVTDKNKLKNFRLETKLNVIKAPKDAPAGVFHFDRIPDTLANQTYQSYQNVIKKDPPLPDSLRLYSVANPREIIDAFWAKKKSTDSSNMPERYAYAWNGSIFNDRDHKLNLAKLANPLENLNHKILSKGVNRSMLLIGGKSSTFQWHNEDRNYASILYLHFGGDKLWIIVHPISRNNFEAAIKRDFGPFEDKPCANLLKHKRCATDLEWLDTNKIVYSIVSECSFLA